jgi:argininosuccinate synthase
MTRSKKEVKRVVPAYSGGLGTSIMMDDLYRPRAITGLTISRIAIP